MLEYWISSIIGYNVRFSRPSMSGKKAFVFSPLNVFSVIIFKGLSVTMYQVILLLLLLYISNSSSSGDTESTTLHRTEYALSTEPTIFHYPRTDSERIRHIALRDVGGMPFPSSSPRYPPQIPSYAPPSRTGFFTPPLPPEYLNPFAGKPTLRGSNSETSHPQRRPIPPPPLVRPTFEGKDRVPLPPPDFMVPEQKPSGKKALNTPSRPNSHQTFESAFKDVVNAMKPENPNSRQYNDSEFEIVPILQYPSVSRILSGSSGRKHDIPDMGDRHSGPNSRHGHHNLEQMAKNLPPLKKEFFLPTLPREPPPPVRLPEPPQQPPPVAPPVLNKTEIIPVVKVDDVIKKVENESVSVIGISIEEPPSTERKLDTVDDVVADSELQKIAEGGVYLWSVAWDIHVYLIASLFAILAVYTLYNLILLRFYRHLLPRSYFITIHVLVAVICTVRAVYLFHDAYNIRRSYPDSVSRLLLNIACPLITTSFAAMFLFLVKTTEVWVARPLQHPICLILLSLTHLTLCVCLDMTSDLNFELSGRKYLPLICQGVYIVLCILLGGGYLYMYNTLAATASRKQMELFGAVYTTDVRRTRPVALCMAIRICLAIAMLILLMAVVQIYGAIGVPENPEPGTQRWLWWAYQFSVRVIEIAVCALLVWAAMQRLHNEDEKETNSQNSTTGFALFPCGPCRTNDENLDDIYPAVCNTNQAIHNYSLRTGKKVYDDVFPLNSMDKRGNNGSMTWNNYDEIGPGSEVVEVKDALTRKGLSTLNRSDSERSGIPGMPRMSGTLPGERRRPRDIPSSMLVDENGFVRFRSLAADDALRRAAPGNKSLPRRTHDPR